MRISDSMRYRLLLTNISRVSQQLDSIQTKVATQKEINSPSDDPIKFSASIEYDTEVSSLGQYNNNLQRLGTLVSMYGVSFESIGAQLSSVMEAANSYATMSDDLREAASEQIEATIEQFVTIGNTKLGNTYIFGGKEANETPFQLNSDYSVIFNVSERGEDATNIYVDNGQLGKLGVSGRQSFFSSSKIAFGGVSNGYSGDIYCNTESFSYVIDATNNTLRVNGQNFTISSGVYSGGELAQELQNQLQTNLGVSCTVAFDSTSRKFLITNTDTSGASVTFNWSNGAASARSVFGFDGSDDAVTVGSTIKSDLDTARKSFLVKITTAGSTSGALSSRAKYVYSIDGGSTWLPPSNQSALTVNTGGADTTDDIVINGTDEPNNGLYMSVNGTEALVTLTAGTYTGVELAEEIEDQLESQVGAGIQVTYTAETKKFTIINHSGSTVTLDWSDSRSTATGVLGFDNSPSIVGDGESDTGDYVAGMFIDGKGIANTTNNGIKLLFQTSAAEKIVINGTDEPNNGLYLNVNGTGVLVTLASGSYTGPELAEAIEDQLESQVGSFQVTYNSDTKTFTITNQTGDTVTLDWSDSRSTAAGVLGFDDDAASTLIDGGSDASDRAAEFAADGTDTVDSTITTLSVNDTFSVKDLGIFELLKNFKDAFDSGNSNWVSKNVQYLDKARSLTTTNNAVISFQGTLANALVESNQTRTNMYQSINSDLVKADTAELATQFNILLTTYQALLSAISKIQSVSILNYLD